MTPPYMNTIRFGALPLCSSHGIRVYLASLVFCLLLFAVLPARANVYATHIQVKGVNGNGDTAPGGFMRINFILNEDATAGTTVQIFSSTNLVRTITVPAGSWGTLRGQNTVFWDLKDAGGVIVPYGNYSVSVSAASLGFPAWTQTSSDANSGNYVFAGRGIAVNRNTNSPYYGRVFVSNTTTGPHPTTTPGDQIGILKLNADGSPVEEGEFSNGGYPWQGFRTPYSPWKIAVSDDDYFYANDWSANGDILRFDQTVSPGSVLHVLRADNWGNSGGANLTGPAITGAGTNTQIWMADVSFPFSLGIVKYGVTPNGDCATNDTGISVVGLGGDMNLPPYGLSVDKQGVIYTIQQVDNPDDPNPRVLRFPAYDPSTNSDVPEVSADWVAGTNDFRMCGANGIAADPTGVYVAAAFRGTQTNSASGYTNGQTIVFFATNGLIATNIITGSTNDHTDVCFDNVGNLYDLDNAAHIWRAYSPPGPNQSTTISVGQTIRVLAVSYITSVVSKSTNVVVNFDAPLTNTASQFILQSVSDLSGSLTDVVATVVQINPGVFQATTGPGSSNQFYRIRRQ